MAQSPRPTATANAPTRQRPRASATEDASHRATAIGAIRQVQIRYAHPRTFRPYPNNPRNNATAVEAVMESIRTFGFLVPVIVDNDEHRELAAGHTRWEAACRLELENIPYITAEHLTVEQLNAFRLIDNKVSELATWDFDRLSQEVGRIVALGEIDLKTFGWTAAQLDCLSSMVSEDCLSDLGTTSIAPAAARAERREPDRIRFVLGEFVFHVPAAQYKAWAMELRRQHDFNEGDIEHALKQMLGVAAHG